MILSEAQKQRIKQDLADRLRGEPEVRRVVVFGSFLTSGDPNDLDVAVFQDSTETYLPLAIKYRRLLGPVADVIPIDVIPVRPSPEPGEFLDEILSGEVVYERQRERERGDS